MSQAASKTLYAEALDQAGIRGPTLGGPPQRSDLVLSGAALGLAVAAAVIIGTGGVAAEPAALAAVIVANTLTFAVAGLLWRHGRPSSALGTLLLLEGLIIGLTALAGSAVPGVYLAGVLAGWVAALGLTWLLVSFPRPRPSGAGWIVLSLAFATFAFGELPLILSAANVHVLPVVGRCAEACPANPARVVDAPTLAHTFRHVEAVLQALWGAGILAYLALHFMHASRPRRRMLAPLYIAVAPFAASFAISAAVADAAGVHVSFWARSIFVATRIVAPLGFIGALLFARSYAGAALAYMTTRLVGRPSIASVEQLVRRVLDDPQARLAFWLPSGGRFVGRHGEHVELEPSEEGISWRSFQHGDEPGGVAIVHDSVLGDELELLEAVGAWAMLALENRRLHHDLVDSVKELRASQQRLVSASSGERRKLERDLHDGVQQKLVALRIHLELARDLAEDEAGLSGRLANLGSELDEALEELRSVAHGIYPPLLSEEGLGSALREAARRSTAALSVGVDGVGRLSEECETAIYYCCIEALQNVAKHAGEDAVASLRLWRDERAVHFVIFDDGVGFAPQHRSSAIGLTNMADRIGAVGGALVVRSSPGAGTTIEGRVPVRTRERAVNDNPRV